MSSKGSGGWSNGYYYGSLGNGGAASGQPYDQPSSQANRNTSAPSYGSNGSQSQNYALQSYSQSQQDPWSTYTAQHAYDPNNYANNNYPNNYQSSGSHDASNSNPNNSPHTDSHTNRNNDASDNSHSNQGYNADNRPHNSHRRNAQR